MKTTLDSVLTRLNPLDKSIVLYFYYDNLKIREIAEILNENENTIKTRLKRVKIKLKNQLEHYE
jgi:RNA polymerase sigma-70 factor (ECF subfamily)|tara:strand:+ start:728 stop:919 length:192 start_codon:yes stop_codon:yes gene_type:complete